MRRFGGVSIKFDFTTSYIPPPNFDLFQYSNNNLKSTQIDVITIMLKVKTTTLGRFGVFNIKFDFIHSSIPPLQPPLHLTHQMQWATHMSKKSPEDI